jgi:hypothetical protein
MAIPRGTRASSTSTLIFGLLFTVIGGALVAERVLGRPVWDYVWRLWPLLLVVMGVKVLLDYRSGSAVRRGRR